MERAVVVTGASTGIGRATALGLDAAGFRVYAGVRRDEDARRLAQQASARLQAITLDVTDEAAVAAARTRMETDLQGAPLAGIVNNAGIAVGGPVEFTTLHEWRRQFEVNLFAVVTMIQEFLPLLRAARGRIVNISSVGGRFPQPFIAPYVASKHAVEAVSDSLRMELRPWGIAVVLIEPGSVATDIWDKGVSQADELRRSAPPEALQLYGGVIDRMTAVARREAERGVAPERVAATVLRALTAARPKMRYVVGADARAMVEMRRWLPDRWREEIVLRYARLPRR